MQNLKPNPLHQAIRELGNEKIRITRDVFIDRVIKLGGDKTKAEKYFDAYSISPNTIRG
jgi:hypothetical protein